MFRKRTKAFTLTELLVVVIVLGVLAAVAVPKFTRVLETRRTTEAESMLSAVRTEQEKRCSLGQNYTGDFSKIPAVAYAKSGEGRAQSANYTYALMATGASAVREGKDYVLKMPSYKSGEICCEGEGCEALNKSYPSCSAVSVSVDECAATDVVAPEPEPSGPCDIDPDSCECNPNQSKCCGANEEWNGSACEPKDECEESIGSASSATASTVDTCDGDKTGRYTCDGHFKGTCTDVYTNRLQAQVGGNGTVVSGSLANRYEQAVGTLASYVRDPFMDFKDSLWLAQSLNANPGTVVGGGNYGNDDAWKPEQVKHCLQGQYWDGTRCVDIIEGGGDFEIVDDPVIIPPSDQDCPEGYVWNSSLGRCIKKPTVIEGGEMSIYMKREVTCCGDGQTVETPEDPEPVPDPTEGTCEDPAYAAENACECNPSTANCCTADQRSAGMTYNATSKVCSCPAGKPYNSATKKCEEPKKYTCYTGYSSKTVANPDYNPNVNTGDKSGAGWRVVSANYAVMKCGNSRTTVSYQKGQQASCTPGQEYLYNMTWGYKAGQWKGYSKYYYTCLKCNTVTDLSQCGNFTVASPTSGGSSSGGEYLDRVEADFGQDLTYRGN